MAEYLLSLGVYFPELKGDEEVENKWLDCVLSFYFVFYVTCFQGCTRTAILLKSDKLQQTSIWTAIENNHVEIALLLIAMGVDFAVTNEVQLCLLIICVFCDWHYFLGFTQFTSVCNSKKCRWNCEGSVARGCWCYFEQWKLVLTTLSLCSKRFFTKMLWLYL